MFNEIYEMEKAQEALAQLLARQHYAQELERIFVKQMMDVYVSLEGRNEDELLLKYVLWSRPLVNKFASDGKILSTAKSLGFKKVTFHTGYREYWYYNL